MPLLKIETNVSIDHERQTALLKRASETVAEILGKPERYVMVILESDRPMLFAGEEAPTAMLQLKSLGMPESRTGEFSAALCRLVEEQLGIDPDRTYIEFSGPARHLWGWNGGTF